MNSEFCKVTLPNPLLETSNVPLQSELAVKISLNNLAEKQTGDIDTDFFVPAINLILFVLIKGKNLEELRKK